MKLTLLTSLGCLIAAVTCPAQALSTAPAGFEKPNSDANGVCTRFGMWKAARYQLSEGTLTKAGQISAVAFRIDAAFRFANIPARTWTQVTLLVSETDVGKLTATFSTNATTTQTQVYKAKFSMPNPLKIPASQRANYWDHIRFPFSKAWTRKAGADVLLDFSFRGGRFDNAATWNTSLPMRLDAVKFDIWRGAGSVDFGRLNANCGSTSQTALLYPKTWRVPGLADTLKYSITVSVAAGPPFQPVIVGFGLLPLKVGVLKGARCGNWLRVLPAFAPVFFTDRNNRLVWSPPPAPWIPGAAGLKFYTQALYQNAFTRASVITVPSQATNYLRKSVVISVSDPAVKNGTPSDSWTLFPLPAFTIK